MRAFSRIKSTTSKKLRRFMQSLVEEVFEKLVAVIPHPMPPLDAIEKVKVIAHRGAHREALENTIEAFDIAALSGVDGIEFDIRWTADGELVVCHDPSCRRVFRKPHRVCETAFSTLRNAVPSLPKLSEVLSRYSGSMRIQGSESPPLHFMIELKGFKAGKKHGWTADRLQRLADELKPLNPCDDYHLMSLNPRILTAAQRSGFFPPKALLSIATTNTARISRTTLSKEWGGITGHFFLLSKKTQALHQLQDQKIGVGFVQSENSFRRQIHRGAAWVFSNDAISLAKIKHAWLTQNLKTN